MDCTRKPQDRCTLALDEPLRVPTQKPAAPGPRLAPEDVARRFRGVVGLADVRLVPDEEERVVNVSRRDLGASPPETDGRNDLGRRRDRRRGDALDLDQAAPPIVAGTGRTSLRPRTNAAASSPRSKRTPSIKS